MFQSRQASERRQGVAATVRSISRFLLPRTSGEAGSPNGSPEHWFGRLHGRHGGFLPATPKPQRRAHASFPWHKKSA